MHNVITPIGSIQNSRQACMLQPAEGGPKKLETTKLSSNRVKSHHQATEIRSTYYDTLVIRLPHRFLLQTKDIGLLVPAIISRHVVVTIHISTSLNSWTL